MLPVDDRLTVMRFAALKELPIAGLTDSDPVEAEHRRQRELVLASRCGARHAHPPVGSALTSVAATSAGLMIEEAEDYAVLHDVPVSGFGLGECRNGKHHSCRQCDGDNRFNEHRVLLTGSRPEGRHYVWRDRADLKVGTVWRSADLKVGTTSGATGPT